MEKEMLFCATLSAAERLNKAIAIGFPGYIIDGLDAELEKYWKEIEHCNWVEEFAKYALN